MSRFQILRIDRVEGVVDRRPKCTYNPKHHDGDTATYDNERQED